MNLSMINQLGCCPTSQVIEIGPPVAGMALCELTTAAATMHDHNKKDFAKHADSTVNDHAVFNWLLKELLTSLMNCDSRQINRELDTALKHICNFLQIDQVHLWRRANETTESLVLTNRYPAFEILPKHGSPDAPSPRNGESNTDALSYDSLRVGYESNKFFNWVSNQAMRGMASIPASLPIAWREGLAHSTVVVPFLKDGQVFGAASFALAGHKMGVETEWPRDLTSRLELVGEVLASAVSRKTREDELTLSGAEIKRLKDRLQTETAYLKAEIKVAQTHGEIIGRSQAIQNVLHQVEQVAPADCAVLINGETGTGKELIAQQIHSLSMRKERPMVVVNCAALPSALVESELFGRERGAYTGALTSQTGRFEIADGSTIFLDEVGELSLEVQAKLLRVLQQGEFERLGSPKKRKVNVRVVAATNRDLAEAVCKGRFREDLYYRLNVFPIKVPPLRERVEDIPPLVFAFMDEFATRMGKRITKVARTALEALEKHPWPGNIRELRNVIEHSVILSSCDTLKLFVFGDAPTRDTQLIRTLAQAERDHITKTLEATGWRIKGLRGAAKRLDMQPSTLYSRMQKLGIPHRRQKDEMFASGFGS